MVYKAILVVGMQHRLRQSHFFSQGFISLLLLNSFVLNSFLNLSWWKTYLDFIAKGCQGLYLWDIFGI